MRHILAILAALCFLAAPAAAQTLKALMYNTNGQIVYSATNTLTFTNAIIVNNTLTTPDLGADNLTVEGAIYFTGALTNVAVTRANLGFSTNLNTLWMATNDSSARDALVLGASAEPTFLSMTLSEGGESFTLTAFAGSNRDNLGLGAGNTVTFAGLTNNGDIRINQTTATNGLLFVYRTNNEPFLGLANLIASNNTTVSNETLFRVGVAEATNRAAQFGFRSTNTNGNGVAVFSVFGFNALMQIGADASTNAVIYSGGGTNNEVMTLIKNGATEFARPIAFSTTTHAAATRTNLGLGVASDPTFRDVSVRDLSIVGGSGGKIVYPSTNTAPANTNNVVTWIQVNVGTNAYRVPLYQ